MKLKNFAFLFALAFIFWPKAVLPAKAAETNTVNYLRDEIKALEVQLQALELQSTLSSGEVVLTTSTEPGYMQVTDTCNWAFAGGGGCVNIRTGPGTSYSRAYLYMDYQGPKPQSVRSGQMFYMSDLVKAKDGSLWYKIDINTSKLMFPNRFSGSWYVSAKYFTPVSLAHTDPQYDSVKRILVVLHEQKLYAYEGNRLYMTANVSTGRDDEDLPTPTGDFHIYKKLPIAVMEGPLPGTDPSLLKNPSTVANFEYTLFSPFAMAFDPSSEGTAFIHGAYWHDAFGTEHSHGCVNLNYSDALKLYNWTPDPAVMEIPVTVIP